MNNKIIIMENNEEKEFDELFTFDIAEKNKSYIGYTDYSTDKNGNILIRLSEYDPTGENPKYTTVTDEDVLKVAQKIIDSLQKSVISSVDNKEN